MILFLIDYFETKIECSYAISLHYYKIIVLSDTITLSCGQLTTRLFILSLYLNKTTNRFYILEGASGTKT